MTNIFVLCGPPATGKGYFSELMEELLVDNGFDKNDIDLIPVGEILREEKANGNNDVDKVSINDETNFSCNIVMEIFRKKLNPKAKVIMIDGIPRTLLQLKRFEEMTKKYNVYVIFLNGGEDILMKKMLKRSKEENRADDTIENFKKRLVIYKEYTLPAIKKMQKDYGDKFIEVSTNTEITKERVKGILKMFTLKNYNQKE
ncbi:MAG: nucleoside monophosphate kinase [Lactobacillaceae bacterium]|jgi:adenylate kinase family enzyme|nr:nucleoside monophosphate kinase [Lactobacillaceae bacterium]